MSYLGDIILVAFDMVPRGWAACNGKLLSVRQHPLLFQLIGNSYGGDGIVRFALPNLNGKIPIGQSSGKDMTPYKEGQTSGSPGLYISKEAMPKHTHDVHVDAKENKVTGNFKATMYVNNGPGTETTPENNFLAMENGGSGLYATSADAGGSIMNRASIDSMWEGKMIVELDDVITKVETAGGSKMKQRMPPYLALKYIINIDGHPPGFK